MECHSIQFTTISINVERGIVKILFKYRYFQDLLIDIDIDIDISQILLIDIDIFQNHHIDIDIDIDIFGIALSISISIFLTSPYRYRYSSKVSIYRQSIYRTGLHQGDRDADIDRNHNFIFNMNPSTIFQLSNGRNALVV